MPPQTRTRILTLLFALLPLAVPARAQTVSGPDTSSESEEDEIPIYGRLGAGLSGYGRDLSRPPMNDVRPTSYPTALTSSMEVGYRFDDGWRLGLSGSWGRYPRTYSNRVGVRTRASWHLHVRQSLRPLGPITPYLMAGAHVTDTDRQEGAAYGPTGGAGLEVILSEKVALFAEAQIRIALPTRGPDRPGGEARFRRIPFASLGIQIPLPMPDRSDPDPRPDRTAPPRDLPRSASLRVQPPSLCPPGSDLSACSRASGPADLTRILPKELLRSADRYERSANLRFAVQVGAFAVPENALGWARDIQALVRERFQVSLAHDEQTDLFKIIVNPTPVAERAALYRHELLSEYGFWDAFVVRLPSPGLTAAR